MLLFWVESPISWLHGPSLKQRSTTSRLPYSDLHCILAKDGMGYLQGCVDR